MKYQDALLTDKEIKEAWDNAFEKGINFDHKPAVDELFQIKLRAVAQAQLAKLLKPGRMGENWR